MTNAIGTGTRNITINVPTDEREFWGTLAAKAGQSIGEMKRRAALRGLEATDPEAAARLREIRRQYYGAAFVFLFVGLVGASWVGHSSLDRARVARTSRAVRRVKGFEFDALEGQI